MSLRRRLVIFAAIPALLVLLLFVGLVLTTIPAETAPGPCHCAPF